MPGEDWMPFHELTEVQLDAFREISSVGMGHAATVLSQMIGQKVELRVPDVKVVPISAVADCMGEPNKLMIGIYLQILGQARGTIMLLLPESSARHLCDRLLGRATGAAPLDENRISTLKEVGNILASAYLNAVGDLLQRTLIPSVPSLSRDRVRVLADPILIDLGRAEDMALMVETEFGGDLGSDRPIKGQFFMIPDPQTFDTFLAAVAIK